MRIRLIPVTAVGGLLLLLLPAESRGYTIVFRDDSTLITLERYQTVGTQAWVTLPSGTQTEFPLTEINLEKTEEINRIGVRRGLVIDRPDTKVLVPPRRSTTETIADLVRLHRLLGIGSRNKTPPAEMQRTHAGNLDLFAVDRNTLSTHGFAEALKTNLESLGTIRLRVLDGTTESRLLLDFTTSANKEVFQAIGASARALIETRAQGHDLEALELIMSTPTRIRAAQFVLTPHSAQALVDESITVAEYFVRNVQF